MVQKPMAVLGGGAGAHMMAADLTNRGFAVHLYEHPRLAEGFRPTLEKGAVAVTGIGPVGTFKLERVSTDMAATLEGAQWINVVIPAVGHDLFFRELIPCLKPGHKVVVWAGDFGSLLLRQRLLEQGRLEDVVIMETNTLPYGTRVTGPASVALLVSAPEVMAAALPSPGVAGAVEELKTIFPCVFQGRHVLEAAFNNPNPIVHPPGSLLNTGRIEYSGGDFRMYGEGITQSVAYVIKAVYEESDQLARALDFRMKQYRDIDFRTKCSIMGVEFEAPFDTCGVIGSILGPTSVQSRYITEDLP
ncbi:MAG: NAD/NADP octopine/nopaline dehydrogenase family protein, partial [Thermodesulfobacteriota bacterium]